MMYNEFIGARGMCVPTFKPCGMHWLEVENLPLLGCRVLIF